MVHAIPVVQTLQDFRPIRVEFRVDASGCHSNEQTRPAYTESIRVDDTQLPGG